ncbi:terminase gpP N-terminus-related DNA-binding protein [Chromobacterium sphagni]|uniref:terminase gpP N-terminus-related DNA-binding protein n=1 Tax=Chromobacterium sphagni TaxID=1903179 RepID=UPI001F4D50E5|nr:hypothetical protein [Chromobacterium sphagni]
MNSKLPIPDDMDPRRVARALYWQGWRIARIAEHVGAKSSTVHSWKRRDGWDDSDPAERIGCAIETRLQQLILKERKEGSTSRKSTCSAARWSGWRGWASISRPGAKPI